MFKNQNTYFGDSVSEETQAILDTLDFDIELQKNRAKPCICVQAFATKGKVSKKLNNFSLYSKHE